MKLRNLHNGNYLGLPSLAVLLAALLGPLTSAWATDWGFNLIGHPSTVRDDDPVSETISMTGAGTFNAEDGTASGGGSFTTINAFDDVDLGGPIFHGTWEVADFISWEDGILQVTIALHFKVGVLEANKGFVLGPEGVILTLSSDGISLEFFGGEDAGGENFGTDQTGSVAFHPKGK